MNISFKDSDRDIELLMVVNSAYDKSDFVKRCIAYYIKNHKDLDSDE